MHYIGMNNNFPFNPSLLTEDEPTAISVVNGHGKPRFVLTCDHASQRIPLHMKKLGLSESDLNRHIAWDIGAANVTKELSKYLDAPAYLSCYSRLIIDCNRPLSSPTSIPTISDETIIPANQNLSIQEAHTRANTFFLPYNSKISNDLDRMLNEGATPIFTAIHSFTPKLTTGKQRPWHIGLLWEHDSRLVSPLRDALNNLVPGICIGENEPYAIVGPSDYSIPEHGFNRGLPHIEIEIRQDLISSKQGEIEWAQYIAEALERALPKILTDLSPTSSKRIK